MEQPVLNSESYLSSYPLIGQRMDPPPQWPKYGEIIFANVWFKYQPEGEDGGQVEGPFARFKVLMESRSNGNLCNQCKYQCAPASSISLTSLIYDCYVL